MVKQNDREVWRGKKIKHELHRHGRIALQPH
jgi:hypothetical protein